MISRMLEYCPLYFAPNHPDTVYTVCRSLVFIVFMAFYMSCASFETAMFRRPKAMPWHEGSRHAIHIQRQWLRRGLRFGQDGGAVVVGAVGRQRALHLAKALRSCSHPTGWIWLIYLCEKKNMEKIAYMNSSDLKLASKTRATSGVRHVFLAQMEATCKIAVQDSHGMNFQRCWEGAPGLVNFHIL